MKLQLPGIALVALAATVVGCGSNGPETRLRIAVDDGLGARAYELRCDPAGGTAPHPERICDALRRHGNLLVGGPGIGHSCPGPEGTSVAGKYRGYRIHASFSNCAWIPGQGDAGARWFHLLEGGARTNPSSTARAASAPPRESPEEVVLRHKLTRRAERLRLHVAQLARERRAAIKSGKLHVVEGQKPDALTLAILRGFAVGVGLPHGPFPVESRVYSTRRRKAEALIGGAIVDSNPQVYLIVLRFDYADYTGTDHRAPGAMTITLDAKSLRNTDWGVRGKLPDLASLGPATALPL